jgi:peptidylprolyl isomerase
MPVKGGDTVRVHYTGTLDDGTEFDSSKDRDPLEFAVGMGQVIPGFEAAVVGLEPGESTKAVLAAIDAYGFRNEALVQPIPLADFGEEKPFLGGVVSLVAPDGSEMPGLISKIEGDEVMIDMNHPLAGETLTFEIELVEIVDPAQAAAAAAERADA